jgi:hypothetical protein
MIQLMGFAMASSQKQGAMRAHFLKLDNIERENLSAIRSNICNKPIATTTVLNNLFLVSDSRWHQLQTLYDIQNLFPRKQLNTLHEGHSKPAHSSPHWMQWQIGDEINNIHKASGLFPSNDIHKDSTCKIGTYGG